jgi:hypothetical protein
MTRGTHLERTLLGRFDRNKVAIFMTMMLRKDEAPPKPETLYSSPPHEVADHPLFKPGSSVGMMTAEAPRYPAEDKRGNFGLSKDLHQMGLKHEPTHGSYGGPESSFIIYGPTREQMYRLGKRYGQEAVIYSRNGRHEMLYTHGPNEGKANHSIPTIRFSTQQPEDYYTHLPGRGYVTLHFSDELHESPIVHTMPMETRSSANDKPVNKSEVALGFATVLRKSIGAQRWAGSYPWHEGHTQHHQKSVGGGVIVTPEMAQRMVHLSKAEPIEPKAPDAGHPTNDQAAGVGVSTYAKHAAPYGNVNKEKPSNLKFYPMEGTGEKVNQLVHDNGYKVYYAGGKNGKADLAGKNYNTGHLMIWDPSAGSGGDFGHADYTDNWRKIHELAHALTYNQLNDKYGEGRRMGGLGKQRTAHEAKRAVEWEWLAAHKQRELAGQIGIHIPDEDFHRELNTVMHDAVHRAVTGKFTEPSDEGFDPHPHKVPLENALGMVDEAAGQMGLKNDHDLMLRKFAGDLLEVLQKALDVLKL